MLLKGFCWNISCLNCGIWDTATFRKHSYLREIGARRRYLKSTLDPPEAEPHEDVDKDGKMKKQPEFGVFGFTPLWTEFFC